VVLRLRVEVLDSVEDGSTRGPAVGDVAVLPSDNAIPEAVASVDLDAGIPIKVGVDGLDLGDDLFDRAVEGQGLAVDAPGSAEAGLDDGKAASRILVLGRRESCDGLLDVHSEGGLRKLGRKDALLRGSLVLDLR